MPKDAIFSLKLETELRDDFMAEAEAAHRPASQLLRELMPEFIRRQREFRNYDDWFRAQVEEAVREADDTSVHRIPQDEAATAWQRQRAEFAKRAGRLEN